MINKISNSKTNFSSKQTIIRVEGKKTFNELNLLVYNRVLPIVNQHIPDLEHIKKDFPGSLISKVGRSTTTLNQKIKENNKITAHSFATKGKNELINNFSTRVKKIFGFYIIKDGRDGNNTITKNPTTFIKRLAYLIVDHLSDPV